MAGSLKLKLRVSPSISVPLKAIAAVAVSSSVLRDVNVETVGASLTAAISNYFAPVSFSKRMAISWYAWDLSQKLNESRTDVFFATGHKVPTKINKYIKVIYLIHDLTWRKHPFSMPFLSLVGETVFFAKSIKRSHALIAISETTKKDLLKFYSEQHIDVTTWHPFFDSHIKAKTGPKQGFLYVGNFGKRKNLARLIEAYFYLPILKRKQNNLVIAGNFSPSEVKRRYPNLAHNPEQGVVFMPMPDDKTLTSLYQKSSALVVPSIYEGFGLPIMESFAAGTPVIISDIPIFREISGGLATFFDPTSVISITQALLSHSENGSVRYQHSELLANRTKMFSRSKSLSTVKNILDKLPC